MAISRWWDLKIILLFFFILFSIVLLILQRESTLFLLLETKRKCFWLWGDRIHPVEPPYFIGEELWSRELVISLLLNFYFFALTSVAQVVGPCSTKWNVGGSIPGQGSCVGCGLVSVGEHMRSNLLMFLSHWCLSPSLSPLSKNK